MPHEMPADGGVRAGDCVKSLIAETGASGDLLPAETTAFLDRRPMKPPLELTCRRKGRPDTGNRLHREARKY